MILEGLKTRELPKFEKKEREREREREKEIVGNFVSNLMENFETSKSRALLIRLRTVPNILFEFPYHGLSVVAVVRRVSEWRELFLSLQRNQRGFSRSDQFAALNHGHEVRFRRVVLCIVTSQISSS